MSSQVREQSATRWLRSSYSTGDGGNCLEWAPGATGCSGTVPVRDSKVDDGPVIRVPAASWTALVNSVR